MYIYNVYIYVCIYIMCVYTYIHTYIHTYICLFVFLFLELPERTVKPLQDKIALEKHRGFLECQVSRANAKVKWYIKDLEIHPSDKYEILSDGVYQKLIINDANYEDEDTYTCDVFDDKSSAHFFVEGKNSNNNKIK